MLQFILLLIISIVVTGVVTLFIIRGDVTNQLNNNVLSNLYDTANMPNNSLNQQLTNPSSNNPSPNNPLPNDPSRNNLSRNNPSPNDPSLKPINCIGEWVDIGYIEQFVNGNIIRNGIERMRFKRENKLKENLENICNITTHCSNDENSRGVFKKKKQIFKITQNAKHGGKTCDVSNNETKEIECIDENVLCDIDCIGEWTPWSECDLSLCGGDDRVEQTRRYIVKQKKQGNGKECDYYDGQTEAKTCICNALDCDGYFEDITNCEINDFCDPFKTNQYKYKKQKFIKTQDAKYSGKDCNYLDNEIILKICNGENGTNKVECDTDCVTQKEIKSECSIEKCEIDPEQVIIKMGTQILKNAVGNNKKCEIANIETINCSDQCKPIDCKFTMGEYGACDTADCDKINNYSVKFELKLKDSWFNKDILLINECKNNIKKVLSEYINISNDKLTIIDIIKNENNTTIIIKINNISKYKSELINNKLYDINILIDVSEDLNKKLKCQRQKICDKKNNNYVCETNGDIIKNCYVMENNNSGKFCDINDMLTNDMEIGIIDVQKNQNVVRKRNIEKTSDAKYGGKCIEPTGDLITSCENECPVNCVGIWEEYGGCNPNKCPNGEEARGKYLKKKMRYRVITPSISGGDQCVDNIYNMGVVKNGQEIEIDCDELCPIDCIEEKQYSRCDIFDECGPMKEDGSYDIEHALEKQVKRRVMWIEKQKSQGRGRKCQNTPQINEQWESCNPIVKCPINCVYK